VAVFATARKLATLVYRRYGGGNHTLTRKQQRTRSGIKKVVSNA